MLIIKNGRIHNAIDPEPFIADILVDNGKITDIKKNIDAPNAEIYDATDIDIYPGFIDAHTHIGMFGYAGDQTKDDISKMPRYDAKLEALIPVIKKEIPLKAHTQRIDDTFTAIRIAKECDVNLTLEHVAGGGDVAEVLAKEDYPIAVGPYISQSVKEENSMKDPAAVVKCLKQDAKSLS